MKKRLVFLMIPALVLVIASVASATGLHWRGIHGTYAMIATGGCLHSDLGFSVDDAGAVFTPMPGARVWGASTMAQAIWTFERNGTGAVSGTNYAIDLPPGGPIFDSPVVRGNPISFDFTYEVTADGAITVTPPSPQPILVGTISRDHKNLTLGNAKQVQPFSVGSVICNVGRILILIDE